MLNIFLRWAKAGVVLLVLGRPCIAVAENAHPLEPPDFSSPRATLNTFLTTGDRALSFLRDRHWDTPSRESAGRLKALLSDIENALDLSGTAPAARWDVGRDSAFYLYEVLSRIKLPSEEQIPGAASINGPENALSEDSETRPVRWTIPPSATTPTRAGSRPFTSANRR